MHAWDGIINLIAACGTGLFAFHVLVPVRRNRQRSLLELRFGLLALVSAAFLLARGLYWATDIGPFLLLSQLIVCFVPLGILLCIEGLMRRHAPLVLKLLAITGTVLALIAALVFEAGKGNFYSVGLAAFQILGLALPFAWAFTRNRQTLSRRENRRIDTLITLTLIGLPFIASDFNDIMPLMPLRMGALAILMFAHSAVLIARHPHRRSVPFWRLLNLTFGSIVLAGLVIWLTDLAGLGLWFKLSVLALAFSTVTSLALEILALRDQSEERALLRLIGALDLSKPEQVVSRLTRFSPFEHAVLVRPGQSGVPASFELAVGKVYSEKQAPTDDKARTAAAILDRLGADLLFVIDPVTHGLCAVKVEDPSTNAQDWAAVLAAIVAGKSKAPATKPPA